MKRTTIYKIVAILLPFIVLGAIELTLRICHYGYDTHLFISDQDSRFWVMNQNISKKYFTINQNSTIGNKEVFYKNKPEGTLRFFVLGASTSLGYPYMHNGTFVRMLKYKLQFAYPENNIEIINLSLTAINSYTLYDFAKQLVNYQPDGIILYAGQNEYYGALGVASSSKLGQNNFFIQSMLLAKESKIVQAIFQKVSSWKIYNSELTNQDLNLMERMAAKQRVPYKSDLYKLGINQYDNNLGKILQLFNKKHIPVFIGTLGFNLKDQKPLCKICQQANHYFSLAQKTDQQENYIQAKKYYIMAKEYDEIRFRAPEVFNDIIKKYSKQYDNVYLVDVNKTLAEYSPHQIIGQEYMLEHVHPNLDGHRLIADAYFESMKHNFFDKHNLKIGFNIDLKNYPTTAFDTICGNLIVNQLKKKWPFNEKGEVLNYDSNNFEQQTVLLFLAHKINWGEAMQRLNNHYIMTNDYFDALKIVEQMCLELPYEKMFFQQAGSLCIQLKQMDKAKYYFKRVEDGY
jgi:hypothetical protein